MNKFGNLFKPLTWFMALLLAGLVAGCGSDDGGGALPVPPPSGSAAGAVCTAGAACVDLLTAGEFTILTTQGITDVPTSPITGNIGSSAITGASILVTCAEVTGSIYATDAAGPAPCAIEDAPKLTQAVTDMGTAYTTANGMANTITPGSGNIDTAACAGAAPGVYNFPGAATILQDCTFTGTATDVWVFKIPGSLTQVGATTVTMAGGALPQNVFWVVAGNVSIGAGAHLEGVVLAQTDIALVTNASVTGRLFAGTAAALDQNTVTRPQ